MSKPCLSPLYKCYNTLILAGVGVDKSPLDLPAITKTRLFKYIENFTTKNWQIFR